MNKNKVLIFLLALAILFISIISLYVLSANFNFDKNLNSKKNEAVSNSPLPTRTTTFSTNKEPIITISSNIPGYEVRTNKDSLEKSLLEIGYWNDNSISHFRNYKLKVKATKLTLSFLKLDEKLTQEAYQIQKDNNGNDIIVIKTEVDLATGEQTVNIGIGQPLLNGSIENPSQWLDSAFWNSIYITLKHVPLPQGGINQEKLTEFLSQQLQKGQIFNLGEVK